MMDITFNITEAVAAISTFFVGTLTGAITMFYKMGKLNERVENTAKTVQHIEKNYVSRTELGQMFKESSEEVKQIHHDLNTKLDTVITNLNQINVTLVGKADKENY